MTELWNRYWYETPEDPKRLALFRVAWYGVLAVDLWMGIEHAARYGAGGFNVSHIPALDPWLPLPSLALIVVLHLVMAWLSIRIALGGASRWGGGRGENALLAAAFGFAYLISQLNSYQHHWLVFLMLVVLVPVRWSGPTPTWPVQLARVQIALLYAWTAFTKLDPLWFDGSLIRNFVGAAPLVQGFAGLTGIELDHAWLLGAWGVLAVELLLVVGILVPRLRSLALLPGLALHLVLESGGLQIGLFSWYMVAFYVLLIPPRWLAWLPSLPEGGSARGWIGVALAAGLIAALPVEGAGVAAGIVAMLFLLGERNGDAGRARRAVVHLAACAGLLALGLKTEVLRDLYHFQGGDLRRRGQLEGAEAAYRRAVEIDPDYADGWTRVGDAQWRLGNREAAIESWRIGGERAGENVPLIWLVVQRLKSAGDREGARRLSERILELQPDHAEARALLAE